MDNLDQIRKNIIQILQQYDNDMENDVESLEIYHKEMHKESQEDLKQHLKSLDMTAENALQTFVKTLNQFRCFGGATSYGRTCIAMKVFGFSIIAIINDRTYSNSDCYFAVPLSGYSYHNTQQNFASVKRRLCIAIDTQLYQLPHNIQKKLFMASVLNEYMDVRNCTYLDITYKERKL